MAVDAKQFAGGDGKFFVVGKQAGMNNESPRESIPDEKFAWLENMQPIADGHWRSLYSNGTALYTTSNPRTIVYHYPFNIGSTNYIFVVLDNGTALAVNTDTAATTTITSTVGAFYPGTTINSLPQAVQVGNSYLVIISQAAYGYAVWDGTNLYFPGTLTPIVTITDGGSGYVTAPTVQFFGGTGTGMAAAASVNNGAVTSIAMINPGSGFSLGDIPTITLVGGQSTGSGAALTAVLSSLPSGSGAVLTLHWHFSVFGPGSLVDQLLSVTVTSGGSGYSSFTTATLHKVDGGYWTQQNPSIGLTIVGGVITAATVNYNGGSGYWFNNNDGSPTVSVDDNGGGFFVSSVTITASGTNYSPSTVIAVTTASTTANVTIQAQIVPVITGGHISSVDIQNGGQYTSNVAPVLTETDTSKQAKATVSLMPFGMAGTCVEVYQSRVWIGNGSTIEFSAAGLTAPFDWSVADGAGAFGSTDSFLRREFTNLKQTSSFLYLFADSSINVISNVQESGTPTLVTFNNQNISQIGTPWHNSVVAIEDSLIFANVQGVFQLRGGNVQKVSDDIDGIFLAAKSTLQADIATTQPSAALMTINDKMIYMLVVPVQGPLDGSPRTGLIMWDQKNWWVGSQDQTFTQVATQEIDSQIQAWGNTTTTIRKLFTTASGTLTKLWQSKLWSENQPYLTRQAMRFYTMALDKSSGGYTFTGTYDFRLEGTGVQTQAVSVTDTALTGSGSTAANVRGNYLGITLSTSKDDFILIGHALLYQEQSPLGG